MTRLDCAPEQVAHACDDRVVVICAGRNRVSLVSSDRGRRVVLDLGIAMRLEATETSAINATAPVGQRAQGLARVPPACVLSGRPRVQF